MALSSELKPTVVVVVVNWNGRDLLPDCLSSLEEQCYPRDRYEIVLVDNGSVDDSVATVRRDFRSVRVIEAGANLGFAAGNNLAIGQTDSEYVALLNNDAVAEPNWLEELVGVAETDERIGAVSSKIWLTCDRLVFSVSVSSTFIPGGHDLRRLGAQIPLTAELGDESVELEFVQGAFGVESGGCGPFRWITASAAFRVPMIDPAAREMVLRVPPAPRPAGPQPTIEFRVLDEVVAKTVVPADEPLELRVPVAASQASPVIQNAGSVVLPNGAGSDRGSVVVDGSAFYDVDRGQYDAPEDVPAFCGAAALLRRRALDHVGTFDPAFFLYYEDTDLALRLRAGGWRVVYGPTARVRHHHSATSVEWSPTFCYFTERNRLLMLIKNGDGSQALEEWWRYTRRLLHSGETPENRRRFLLVQRSLLRHAPAIAKGRIGAAVGRRLSPILRATSGPQ